MDGQHEIHTFQEDCFFQEYRVADNLYAIRRIRIDTDIDDHGFARFSDYIKYAGFRYTYRILEVIIFTL